MRLDLVFRKAICLGLTGIFIPFSVSMPPLQAAPSDVMKAEAVSDPALLRTLQTIKIPASLGSVRQSWFPENAGQDLSRAVIFLEDAHTQYDSEKSIQRLIQFFREKAGVSIVFLEGGEGELDRLFFQSFPDREMRERVLDGYLRKGDLSGGEAAAVLDDSEKAVYWGAESSDLYRQNRKAYLDAVRNEDEILWLLSRLEGRLEKQHESTLSDLTRIFWSRHQAFRKEVTDLVAYVRDMKVFFPGEKRRMFDENFPGLAKILAISEQEDLAGTDSIQQASRIFVETFKAAVYPYLPLQDQRIANEKMQAYRTAVSGPGDLARELSALARKNGRELSMPENLRTAATFAVPLSSLRGSRIFEEVRAMEKMVAGVVAASPQESEVLEDLFRLNLLEDLARLDLTRDDWKELKGHKPSEWIRTLPGGESSLAKLDRALKTHFNFYELATQRDEAIFRNTLSQMKQRQAAASILVTGGFHSEGVSRKLQLAGIPYVLVTPATESPGSRNIYRNVMQGKRSFMRYYRGGLWDAMAQDYAARMAAGLDPADLTPVLKEWRDRIIQNAIAEGRITKAGLYTRYVDALVQVLRREYASRSPFDDEGLSASEIHQKLRDELGQFMGAYFNRIRSEGLLRLQAFTDGVRERWLGKEMSPESVSELLGNLYGQETSTLAVPLALIPDAGMQDTPVAGAPGLDEEQIRERAQALQSIPVPAAELLRNLDTYETLLRTQDSIFGGPLAENIRGAFQGVARIEDALAVIRLARKEVEKKLPVEPETASVAVPAVSGFQDKYLQSLKEQALAQREEQNQNGEITADRRAATAGLLFLEARDLFRQGRLVMTPEMAAVYETLSLSCSVCAVELRKTGTPEARAQARAVEEVLGLADREALPQGRSVDAQSQASLLEKIGGVAVSGPLLEIFREAVAAADAINAHTRVAAFPLIPLTPETGAEVSVFDGLTAFGTLITIEKGALVIDLKAAALLDPGTLSRQLHVDLIPAFQSLGLRGAAEQEGFVRLLRLELRRMRFAGYQAETLRLEIVRNLPTPADYDFDNGVLRFHEKIFNSGLSLEDMITLLDFFAGHEFEHHRLTQAGTARTQQETEVIYRDLARFSAMRSEKRERLIEALRVFGRTADFSVDQQGDSKYLSLLKTARGLFDERDRQKTAGLPVRSEVIEVPAPQEARSEVVEASVPLTETVPQGSLADRFGNLLERIETLREQNRVWRSRLLGLWRFRKELLKNEAEIKRIEEGFDQEEEGRKVRVPGLADLAIEAYETRDPAMLRALVEKIFESPGALSYDSTALRVLVMALSNQTLSEQSRAELFREVRQKIQGLRGASEAVTDGLFALEAAMVLNEGDAARWFEEVASGRANTDPSPLWKGFLGHFRNDLTDSQILILQGLLFHQWIFFAALAGQQGGAASPYRTNGRMRAGIGLRDIQKTSVRNMLEGAIALAATSAGKNIVGFLRAGNEIVRSVQYSARTGRPQSVGAVINAETRGKAHDFVDGTAPIPVKIPGPDGVEIKIRLFPENQFLARLFGASGGIVSLQQMMENHDEEGLLKALGDPTSIKVIAYDQVGFSEIAMGPKTLEKMKAVLDSWGIEEIDKLGSENTQFIMSDTENAVKNPKEFLDAVRRLYGDMQLRFGGDGKSPRVKFVDTAEQADELWKEANEKKEDLIIVWGGTEARGRRAAISSVFKERLLQKGHDPRHLYQALQTALTLEFAADFDGVQGELTPLNKGEPQKTHFSGKVTKVFLSLVVEEIKKAKIEALRKLLGEAADDTARGKIEKDIERETSGLINIEKLENSLTQATNTKFGLFKSTRDFYLNRTRSVPSAELKAASAAHPHLVVLQPLEGDDAGRLDLGVYLDGQNLVVQGRNGTDRIPVSQISSRDEDPTIPSRNNHIGIRRAVDDQGRTVYKFNKQLQLSGSTATFSPNLLYQLGLETVLSDRSGMKRGAQRDARGQIISQGWLYQEALAGQRQEVSELVQNHIAVSQASPKETELEKNTKSFSYVDDTVEAMIGLILGSVSGGVSHVAFQPRHDKLETIRQALASLDDGKGRKLIDEEVRAGQFYNRVVKHFEEIEREIRDLKKKRDPALEDRRRLEVLEAQLKKKDAEIREALEVEQAWLEGQDVSEKSVAGLKADLKALAAGLRYLYIIDSQTPVDLISKIAQIANSRGVPGQKAPPAVVLTSNISGTQQGVDFEGTWTESIDSVDYGNRQLMQIVGRIARNGAAGHRYLLLQREDYEKKKEEIVGPQRNQRRAELRRALAKVYADMRTLLEKQVQSGAISVTKYVEETEGNEFEDALAVLDRLDRNDTLTELDWLMLSTAYNYIKGDISDALAHSFAENHQGIGHRFFRGLREEAERLAREAAALKLAKKKPSDQERTEALMDLLKKKLGGNELRAAIEQLLIRKYPAQELQRELRKISNRKLSAEKLEAETMRLLRQKYPQTELEAAVLELVRDRLSRKELEDTILNLTREKIEKKLDDAVASDPAVLAVEEAYRDLQNREQTLQEVRFDAPRSGERTGKEKMQQDQLREIRILEQALQAVYVKLGGRLEEVLGPEVRAPEGEARQGLRGLVLAQLEDVKEARKVVETGVRRQERQHAGVIRQASELIREVNPGEAGFSEVLALKLKSILEMQKPYDETVRGENAARLETVYRELAAFLAPGKEVREAMSRESSGQDLIPEALAEFEAWKSRLSAYSANASISELLDSLEASCPGCAAEFSSAGRQAMADLGRVSGLAGMRRGNNLLSASTHAETAEFALEIMDLMIFSESESAARVQKLEREARFATPEALARSVDESGGEGGGASETNARECQGSLCGLRDRGAAHHTDGEWQWSKEGHALARAMEDLKHLGKDAREALARQIPAPVQEKFGNLGDDRRLLEAATALADAGLLDFVDYDRRGVWALAEAALAFEALGLAAGSLDAGVLYGIYGDGRSEQNPQSRIAVKALELLAGQGRAGNPLIRKFFEKLVRERKTLEAAQAQLQGLEIREGSMAVTALTGEQAQKMTKQIEKERRRAEKRLAHAVAALEKTARRFSFKSLLTASPPEGVRDVEAYRRRALLALASMARLSEDTRMRADLLGLTGAYSLEQLLALNADSLQVLAGLEKNTASAVYLSGVSEADVRALHYERAAASSGVRGFQKIWFGFLALLGNGEGVWRRLLSEANRPWNKDGFEGVLDAHLAALRKQRGESPDLFLRNAKILERKLKDLRAAEDYETARRNRVDHSLEAVKTAKQEAELLGKPSPYRYRNQRQEDRAIETKRHKINSRRFIHYFYDGDEPRDRFDSRDLDQVEKARKNLYYEIVSVRGLEGLRSEFREPALEMLRELDFQRHAAVAGDLKSSNGYVEDRMRKTGRSREAVEREMAEQYSRPSELFTLGQILDAARLRGARPDEIARVLPLYHPAFSGEDTGRLAAVLEEFGNEPVIKMLDLETLAGSWLKARSAFQAAGGRAALESPSGFYEATQRFGLTALEKMIFSAFAVPNAVPAMIREAPQAELAIPFLEMHAVPQIKTLEQLLAALSGEVSFDFRQAAGLPLEGRSGAGRWTRADLEALYHELLVREQKKKENADAGRIADLNRALARISLARAVESLTEDKTVKHSFKGRFLQELDRAAAADGSFATQTLKWRADAKLNPQRDQRKRGRVGLDILLGSLQDRLGNSVRAWYSGKVQGIADSGERQRELARMLNEGNARERRQALDYIVEGWNLYARENGQAEVDASYLGDLRAEVHQSAHDPLLSRLVDQLGFPDVPLLTLVLDTKSAAYLRSIGFFTETGQANATRPEETPEVSPSSGLWAGQTHLFHHSGYFVRQQGYRDEALEHEFTHLVDLGRALHRGPRRNQLSRFAEETEEAFAKRFKRYQRLNKVLLDENEAYMVQVILHKMQQSGRLYDHDSTENGPFFSYAMDIFREWEHEIKTEAWKHVYREQVFGGRQDLNPAEAKAMAESADAFKKRLEKRAPEAQGKTRSMEEEALARAAVEIRKAGLEEAKQKALREMREMRSAMRYLARYLTPAQLMFLARTARSIQDIIEFGAVEESEMALFAESLERLRAGFQLASGRPDEAASRILKRFEDRVSGYTKKIEETPGHDSAGESLRELASELGEIAPGSTENEVSFKKRMFQPVFDRILERGFAPEPGKAGAGKPPKPEEKDRERLMRVLEFLRHPDRELAIVAMISLFESARGNEAVHAWLMDKIGLSGKADPARILEDSLKLQQELAALSPEDREGIKRVLDEAASTQALHRGLGAYGRYAAELNRRPSMAELDLMRKSGYEFNVTVYRDARAGEERFILTAGIYDQHVETYGKKDHQAFYHIHPRTASAPADQPGLGYDVIPSGAVGDVVRDYDGIHQLVPGGWGFIGTDLGITRYQALTRDDARAKPDKNVYQGTLEAVREAGNQAAREGKAFTGLAVEGETRIWIEFRPRAWLESASAGEQNAFIPFLSAEPRNELRSAEAPVRRRTELSDPEAREAVRRLSGVLGHTILEGLKFYETETPVDKVEISEQLQILYGRLGRDADLAADALRAGILDHLEETLAQRRSRLEHNGASDRILDQAEQLLRTRDLHVMSTAEVWNVFLDAARLISGAPAQGTEAADWAQAIRHLVLMQPRPGEIQEELSEMRVREATVLLDRLRRFDKPMRLEYRLSSRLSDTRSRGAATTELLETVRNTLIINPQLSVRLVAGSLSEERRLRRALGRMTRRYHGDLAAGGRIQIVTEKKIPAAESPVDLMLTDAAEQMAGRGRAQRFFDSLNYADGNLVYYAGSEKVTPSQLFLAAAASLSNQTLEALVEYEAGIVRARAFSSLQSFVMVMQMLEHEIRETLEVRTAA